MQQVRKLMLVFLQALLSGAATIFLASPLFSALTYSWLSGNAELLLRMAGVICTTTAILLLMSYAAHEVKGVATPFPFIAACKHAGHMVLFLLCMLPALLLFSILEGLHFCWCMHLSQMIKSPKTNDLHDNMIVR